MPSCGEDGSGHEHAAWDLFVALPVGVLAGDPRASRAGWMLPWMSMAREVMVCSPAAGLAYGSDHSRHANSTSSPRRSWPAARVRRRSGPPLPNCTASGRADITGARTAHAAIGILGEFCRSSSMNIDVGEQAG
jgi:hypothetical protein